ncbi:MAG: diguanylate cyclase [Ardenticatenaceae bacterium]|nr:diguanylate cyclase [Ardenticatenaceae bacterium]MCB9443046.1 diguanylate cyclase [Ardenticatenaceae bacterium]
MRDFSRPTQFYILGTVISASILAFWQFYQTPPDGTYLLLLACIIASFLQGSAVFGTTVRSTYSLSWIVFGFTFVTLGTPATFTVVLASHLAEWFLDRDRLKWYIQTFNIGTFFIGFTVSGLIVNWISPNPVSGTASFLITLVSLAVFTLINHWLVAWVLKLARGQNLAQSGVFGWFTLLLDFTLLCLGYVAAIIWQANPIALTLVVFITFILYKALNIPALERKTEIDPKTELFNARYFTEALDEEMVRAKKFKRPLSLIMADLDLLRDINNNYGHLAGDVVLQGIARIMQEMTRDYDIVARFGGEEFAIMLPETELSDAYIVAERIREKIAATEFEITTSIHPIKATMSFGITQLEDSKQAIDSLIHNADVALYRAKETGRNRTCIHNGEEDIIHKVSRDWGKLGISVKEMPEPPVAAYTNGHNHKTSQSMVETASYLPSEELEPETAVDNPFTARSFARQLPEWATTAFIAILATLASSLALILINTSSRDIDWLGLIFFAGVVLLTEAVAIEIYVRDSSVSTSAALLVAGVLLFGPVGAVTLGIIIAFAAYAKKRTAISRFIFNSSNHTFGGLLIAALLLIQNKPVTEWSLIRLLIVSPLAAGLVYLSTTVFLTAVICLSSQQNFKEVWVERFRWLGLYYLALGIIAAALVFSYNAIGLTGILIIFLPLIMMRYSQKQYIDRTETMVHSLQKTNTQLVQKSEEITLLNEELLLTLARSLDLRDPHVMEHSKHVSRYAVCIAQEMGLPEEQIETIRKAGLLHDIGKLGVREEILFKPGRLTAEEFELVKEHVIIGAELVSGCHSLEPLAPFVLHHHEWYDGQGYPHGLAGDEIPLEARILCLADAVEAMASDRPYKNAMSPTAIRDEVKRCAGNQFDPVVVEAFARVIDAEGEDVIVNSARAVLARQLNDTRTYAPHY